MTTTTAITLTGKQARYLRGLGHARIGIINGPLRLESARVRSFIVEAEAMFRDARTAAIETHAQTAVMIKVRLC